MVPPEFPRTTDGEPSIEGAAASEARSPVTRAFRRGFARGLGGGTAAWCAPELAAPRGIRLEGPGLYQRPVAGRVPVVALMGRSAMDWSRRASVAVSVENAGR